MFKPHTLTVKYRRGLDRVTLEMTVLFPFWIQTLSSLMPADILALCTARPSAGSSMTTKSNIFASNILWTFQIFNTFSLTRRHNSRWSLTKYHGIYISQNLKAIWILTNIGTYIWVNIGSGAWWHQASACTNVVISSKGFCSIHLGSSLQKVFKIPINKTGSNITLFKLLPHPTGANGWRHFCTHSLLWSACRNMGACYN